MIKNVLSVSGGKDSTAMILLSIALETENVKCVFADTGNEHPITYEYLDYLRDKLNIEIDVVKADFSMQINRKRKKLLEGKLPGWSDSMTERALEILFPSGNPFLDLCLWKGRFPSTKARFCTTELKRDPLINQAIMPELENGDVWSWQGVRRDESFARRNALEFEGVGGGLFNYRPIAKWNVESVFEAHKYMGVDSNPLYKLGMGRVGCMPCINCNKGELRQIAQRFPEEIARIREWEALVSQASKLGSATFFCATRDPAYKGETVSSKTHGIDRRVEWSKTLRGGVKMDLFSDLPLHSCASEYGLCE